MSEYNYEQRIDLIENISPKLLQEITDVSEAFGRRGYNVIILRWFNGNHQELQTSLKGFVNSQIIGYTSISLSRTLQVPFCLM